MKKRIILKIIIGLLLSLLPIIVFASTEIIDSGYFGAEGNNLSWTLDNTGVLTISGTGNMGTDLYSVVNPPWYSHESSIRSIIVCDGVTNISSRAFHDLSNLTSIQIPDSVEDFSGFAVVGSNNLSNIIIDSDSIRYQMVDGILYSGKLYTGKRLIWCPSNIKSITISENVTVIGEAAFFNCDQLENIILPNSVHYIETSAFANCTSLTTVELPYNDIYLYNYAFANCTNLIDLTFSPWIEYISSNAFEDCSNLTSIKVWCSQPNDNLRQWAEANGKTYTITHKECIIDAIPSTSNLYGWTEGKFCSRCGKSFIAPELAPPVASYSGNCGNELLWTLSESGVLTVNGNGTMDNYRLICDYEYLKAFPNTNRWVPNAPWTVDLIKSIVLEGDVASIGNNAFFNCQRLTSVIISDNVTQIGDTAFALCSELVSITIPTNVTSIPINAFYGCNKLNDVYYSGTEEEWNSILISEGNTALTQATIHYNFVDGGACGENLTWFLDDEGVLTVDGTGNFYANLPWQKYRDIITSASFGSGVTLIPYDAFRECSALQSIYLPDHIRYIGTLAFYACDARIYANDGTETAETLGKNNKSFRVPGLNYSIRYLYQSDTLTGKGIADVDNDTISFTVPEDITAIISMAFYNCDQITDITLNDHITEIGSGVFSGCDAVRYCPLDSATAITLSRAGYSFRVPDTVYDLKYLFTENEVSGLEISNVDKSITSITIPDNVTSIGKHAFWNCKSIASVLIPQGVRTINQYSFWDCSALAEITIPSSVNYIGEYAFSECTQLKCISIPDGVTVIEKYTFNGCYSLTDVAIPDSVTQIEQDAFGYCKSLKSIILPDSIVSIGRFAFTNCPLLKDVFYTGSQAKWADINIDSYNTNLLNASIHYGSRGHSLQYTESKDATCAEEGYEEFWICTVCNKMFSDENASIVITKPVTVPVLGHDLEHHDAQAATCTEVGWNGYDTCNRDGCEYSTYVEIPALGHDLEHHDAQAATCITAGNIEYWHCTKCGKYFTDAAAEHEIALADTVIAATGHDAPMEHTDAVEETCITAGNTEYWHCSKCGKYFSDAAAEHEIALADT